MVPQFIGWDVANTIERDWAAGMLPELVCTIARKFVDISDFIRFRAVCKAWRSVTTIADLSPQFPWLLNYDMEPDLRFYSIVLDKSFNIHAPKLSNKYYIHACHGLMLVLPKQSAVLPLSLINPLNNNEISLPSMGDLLYTWIGSRSCQSMDYVAVEGNTHLHILKLGDDKWIDMESKVSETYFYFKNLLFIIDDISRFTKVIDLRTHETVFVVPPPQNTWMLYTDEEVWYNFSRHPTLIESYGEVLYVTYPCEFKKFVIYQLEIGNGQENPHWVEVTSIGDRILFIDFENKGGDFSLQASDFNGLNLKGNCIYYITTHQKFSAYGIIDLYYAVEKYDIESATTEDLHIKREDEIAWYLPALNRI